MATVVPRSYLALSHTASDIGAEEMTALGASVPASARYRFAMRSHAGVSRFFEGLELLTSEVVPIDQWRPEEWSTRPEGLVPRARWCPRRRHKCCRMVRATQGSLVSPLRWRDDGSIPHRIG